MKSVQLIEINDEGKTKSTLTYQVETLPRIHEKIAIEGASGEPRLFEVLDIHHTSETINVYVSFVGSLNNVIGRIARQLI